MKLGRIVTSLLENDLYKFSMGQAEIELKYGGLHSKRK